MNSAEINLVQASFAEVRPNAVAVAELFYQRLFKLNPALRPLFTGDMAQQGRMLMSMLHAAVNGLNDVDALVPVVRRLGANHVQYGVHDEDYDTVGRALLETLEAGLGDSFTPAVRDAWAAAYGLLSNVMLQGADDARANQETVFAQ